MSYIKYFYYVASTLSFSEASKQLFISQSAVSQSLQQLESALGVRLFSRTARGVTLTAEGSVLYDYAAQALSLLEAGEARIAQSRELLKGELSIGVSSTLTKYYLLPSCGTTIQQYPHIQCAHPERNEPPCAAAARQRAGRACVCDLHAGCRQFFRFPVL